ncbi:MULTISPECIES: sulfurtransferase TusA family protein [Shewanella]|jgi:TusA-related sulfurtransferase|uniref:Selenium metabolism protein YedF n=4 Tax=Bacteria TaxID=2 RepID=A0A2T3H540_9GAMM|nr:MULTISPECIES: sulfurtransferase TusA family protein [Shewanella]AXQ13629.1 oxidoreductase [Shewanella algae]AYV15209.1 sulfurtransferase TusA family protein [Shewanella algae]EKT4487473.1 sulfurtransferase TusA family protein [Shewanella algae]MBC8795070.1 sulfurtransferase TusA family protein [Shewanella algae]MBO2549464.1 sulfurtransferase TusA family protein [Shewanella algae]
MKHVLDTTGKLCPFPLIELQKLIKGIEKGDEVVLDYDCAQATENIPRWAAEEGHEVTHFAQKGDAAWTMTIKKG